MSRSVKPPFDVKHRYRSSDYAHQTVRIMQCDFGYERKWTDTKFTVHIETIYYRDSFCKLLENLTFRYLCFIAFPSSSRSFITRNSHILVVFKQN